MMRILQVHNYYKYRGGECEVVDREAELLADNGYYVHQYTKSSRDIEKFTGYRKASFSMGVPFNPTTYAAVRNQIRRINPDVVHVHNVFPLISPSVYHAARQAGKPIVQTIHNYRFLCPRGTLYRDDEICEECSHRGLRSAITHKCIHDSILLSAQYALAIRLGQMKHGFLGNIDVFIALNEFVRDKLAEVGVPVSKVRVLSNYATVFANENPAEKGDYVLYLGRLSEEKGIGLILEAARSLPKLRFLVAGDGPYQPPDETAPENIEWMGRVSGEDKTQLIERANALLVPSLWYENNPMVVIEAMALGTPIIAANTGGLPEMFEHGVSGYVFARGDAASLCAGIEYVMNEVTVKGMSGSALAYARDRYTPEAHLTGLSSIYRAAIGEST